MKKNILIIGGSSSIGKKVIQNLSSKKFNIYTTSNINNVHISKVKNFKCNVKNLDEIKKLIKFFRKKKIKFDYVVFLQGIIYSLDLKSYTEEKILNILSVNTQSVIFFSKEIIKILKNNSLNVYVSSISGLNGSFDPVYAASKSALHGFIKSLSKWMAPKHRFICLSPGPIKNTKIYKNFSRKRKIYHSKNNPMKGLINSSDFSKILINILEPHWKHANGSIISINGGVY